MYYFYIYLCKDGTYYCGSSKNIANREKLHNSGRGAAYTRIHGAGKIIYSEAYATIQAAMAREREVKKWPRQKKEALINSL